MYSAGGGCRNVRGPQLRFRGRVRKQRLGADERVVFLDRAGPGVPFGRRSVQRPPHFRSPRLAKYARCERSSIPLRFAGRNVNRGARLKRWIGKDTSNSWVPFVRADSVILETCTISGGAFSCEVGTAGGTEQQYNGLSASRLSVGVRCGQVVPNTCSTGGTIHHVWAVLYGGSVVVSDPAPPAVSADPGSPLFSGWIRGTRQVALNAADAESGVRELQIFDGAQVRHSALGRPSTRWVRDAEHRAGVHVRPAVRWRAGASTGLDRST